MRANWYDRGLSEPPLHRQSADERQHRIDRGRRQAGEAAELGHGPDYGLDLRRTPALEVLQHRRLVLADRAAAGDALVDVEREAHAERLPDCLSLDHHCP